LKNWSHSPPMNAYYLVSLCKISKIHFISLCYDPV
jgi:hypothetical protein